MSCLNKIIEETYCYLNDNVSSLKCGHLYLPLKIHKIKENILTALTNGTCRLRRLPPGQPIISQCDTLTHRIGAYCDYLLILTVKQQSTYIEDTTDFINKIEALCLPSQIILITHDVTMYTNIEFNELLCVVEEAYRNNERDLTDLPYHNVSDLLFLVKS